MANFNGQNHTGFQNIHLKGTGGVPPQIRADIGDSGFVGTVQFGNETYADQNYALNFPNKSGTMPIMGTFTIQLPQAAGARFSTIVTASGIRAEDALVVALNGATSGTYGFAQSTGYIIVQAIPGNGNFTLQFNNPGNATAYVDLQGSYLAMR
jgi:hypothetical protein